jgi:hypothetical protein
MGSVAWQERRHQWYQHWRSTHDCAPVCVVCGCPWSLRSGQLHHVTYMRLGAEEPGDLVPLCPTHHARLHQLWDSSPQWRALGRAAATHGIIAVLRRRLQAPQQLEVGATAATTTRSVVPTATKPGLAS